MVSSPLVTPSQEGPREPTPLGFAASTEPAPAGLLRFGEFEMDLQAGALYRNGIRVEIRSQTAEMLRVFLKRPGEIITHEEFRRLLWSPDVHVNFDQSVYTAVKDLREVLGDRASHPRYIETRARRGYRFIAPVQVWRAPAAEPTGLQAVGTQGAGRLREWMRGCLCIPRSWLIFLLLLAGLFVRGRAIAALRFPIPDARDGILALAAGILCLAVALKHATNFAPRDKTEGLNLATKGKQAHETETSG